MMRPRIVTASVALAVLLASVLGAITSDGTFAAETRTAYCAGKGDVYFRSSDRTRLIGHSFGRGTTVVVLAHQSGGSLCQWRGYAKRLAANGYQAFAFDFRNHGLSQAGVRWRLPDDVAAAVKYVRAHGAKKVLLVGASMGGTSVLVAGANVQPLVAGVVSVSGPISWSGVDAAAAVPRLQVPVLYLVGSADRAGLFAQDAQALYEATASTDKAIEVIPGTAAHGVGLVTLPGRARELLEQFLRSH